MNNRAVGLSFTKTSGFDDGALQIAAPTGRGGEGVERKRGGKTESGGGEEPEAGSGGEKREGKTTADPRRRNRATSYFHNFTAASSARRRGRVPVGVASESQIAVSIRPLRPSSTILSIAARGGVTESAWLPLKGSIRPTVGDDVVLGRGLFATANAIRLMHMEFFLSR